MNRGRGWLCLAITIPLLTGPFTMQSSAGPGNAGGPPRPPGGGGIGGSDPGGGTNDGPSGGADGGPTPPLPSPPVNVTLTPALPNLVVSKLRSDRDAVRVGSPVRFFATTSNIGHLLAPSALLKLYDGVVDAGHAIGSVSVDLRDFEAKSTLTWTASGAGSHTIIAYADAAHAIAETIESDNTGSVVVTVSNGQVPGVPDLTVNEGDIGLEGEPHAGQTTTVKVRVRNVGEVSASSVLVHVVDNGATVTQYTISSIAAGSANVQSVSWTPGTDGAHFLNVTADPGGGIRELDEDNNIAPLRIGVDPIPGPTCVYNGQTVFQPVRRDEYVVPFGQTDVYVGCLVLAFNVTVYGTLRFLNGSTLVVGKYYPLGVPWPYPVPIPFPFIPRHRVQVESGGLLEFLDSRMTARMATYGYGFEAKSGSAFYANRTVAQFPWGTWPIPLGGGIAPGGLVVRTTNFAFRDSTVAYGRLHGMYLAPSLTFGTLFGDTFLGNNAAGLAVDLGAAATASSSTFRGNQYGLLSVGSSPTITGSLVTANRYGVRSEGTSSTLLTLSQVTRNIVAGAWFQDTGAGLPRITGNPLSERNRFGAYALVSNLTVDNSTFTKEDASIVFDRAPSAILEWSSAASYNFTVTVANGSLVRIAHSTVGVCYYAPCERAPNTTYYYTALSCAGSTCVVSDQTSIPGVCEGLVVTSGSTLEMSGNSSVTHIGCGSQTSLWVRDSLANVTWSLMGGQFSVIAANTTLRVQHNTLVARVNVATSPGLVFEDNDVTGMVYVGDSPNATLRRNDIRSLPAIELTGSSVGALVDDNDLDGVFYFPPDQIPSAWFQENGGNIVVYSGASATIRRNRLVNGTWGISLDAGNALVQDNAIVLNGHIAIGAFVNSDIDIVHNWINRSSGMAIEVQSPYTGVQITDNWINDTDGVNGISCDGSVIVVYNGGAGPIARNHIARTNATGIRVCGTWSAQVHNNTLVGGGSINGGIFSGPAESGITIHSTTSLVSVVDNNVTGFRFGVRVKNVATGLTFARNDLWGNGNGVLVGFGDAADAWADVHDNVIRSNVVGVNVSASNWEFGLTYNATYSGHVTLRRNTIANNTYGVSTYVSFKTYNPPIVPPHAEVWDRNAITGNTYGIYLKGGYLPNGTTYPVYANLTGNNTIANNTQYGVYVDGPTVDPTAGHFWMWWNDVRGNTNGGVYVNGDPQGHWGNNAFFRAYCNWWKDATGPKDTSTGPPDYNPTGQGQTVSDYFHYRMEVPPPPPQPQLWWLQSPSTQATSCHS